MNKTFFSDDAPPVLLVDRMPSLSSDEAFYTSLSLLTSLALDISLPLIAVVLVSSNLLF
jgi:hypothetical protein